MRLGIEPLPFLGRLLGFFLLTYVLWTPFAPAYTRLLAALTEGFLHLTESSSDPNLYHVTVMHVRDTAIFFQNRLFPQVHPPGIPAEWVQANLVLLIPLMLATPAPTYRTRVTRLVAALALALALQVLDLAMTVKSFYASHLGTYSAYYYSNAARRLYQFADAFAQAMDTQLFPFMIWAGIHFNQLLGRASAPAAPQAAPKGTRGATRAARRRRSERKGGSVRGDR